MCKRVRLRPYPQVFGLGAHGSQILVRNCEAWDVVTGQTCESPREQFHLFNPRKPPFAFRQGRLHRVEILFLEGSTVCGSDRPAPNGPSARLRAILIRWELTDAHWQRIERLVPGKDGDKGRHGDDNRPFVDAVLWLARAGRPGVICRRSSGSGLASFDTFGAGPRGAFQRFGRTSRL